jgi:hypothetical protein
LHLSEMQAGRRFCPTHMAASEGSRRSLLVALMHLVGPWGPLLLNTGKAATLRGQHQAWVEGGAEVRDFESMFFFHFSSRALRSRYTQRQ